MVQISSSDNQVFEIEESVIFQSTTIKNMITDLDGSDQIIPLPGVTSEILKKVIEYSDHHKNDDDSDVEKEISEWDKKFMDLDNELIIEIINAANYLENEKLLNLGCQVIANKLKGKSLEENNKILGIKTTPDIESLEISKE